MLSIRGKLVLMLVSALVTAGVVASVATYYSTRMEFSSLFDAQLKHTALELIEGGNIEVNSVALIGQAPQQQNVSARLPQPQGAPLKRSSTNFQLTSLSKNAAMNFGRALR